jgi:hypothetical protein
MGHTLHQTTPKLQDLETTQTRALRVLSEQQIDQPLRKRNESLAIIAAKRMVLCTIVVS